MKKLFVVFAVAVLTAACQNMGQYSAAYQAEHQRVFWAELSGGGTDGGAQAWANLKAHNAAEAKYGK